MKCASCGEDLELEQKLCPNCGAEQAPEEAAPEAPVEAAAEVTAEAPAAEEAAEAPVAEETAEEPVAEVTEAPAEEAPAAPAKKEKKVKKKRRKPPVPVRLLLQLLSLVLSLVLLVGVLAATVVGDIRLLTNKDGIKKIVSSLFSPQTSGVIRPVAGAVGVTPMAEDGGFDMSSGMLADWVMNAIGDQLPEDVEISKEDIQDFLDQSTITDYVGDKVAGYVEDFITGEDTTSITPEEIKELIEENKPLIEDTFQIEITEEIVENITQVVEEADVDKVVKEETLGAIGGITVGGSQSKPSTDTNSKPNQGAQDPTQGDDASDKEQDDLLPPVPDFNEGMTINEILQTLRAYTSDGMVAVLCGICVVLMVLICLCNYYSLPGGLGWCAFPCILLGVILSLPVIVAQSAPELISMIAGEAGAYMKTVNAVVGVIAPVHYGVLGLGLALMVASIILRIIRGVKAKKEMPVF